MRRLVRHGLVGVGAATFAVVAGVTALGTPATTTLALPVATALQVVSSVDPAVESQRAAVAERENRDAERTRIAAAATDAATQRKSNLDAQSQAIGQRSDEIKKAKAKAAAKAAAAEKQRQLAIKNQGYLPGTTDVKEIARQILKNKFDYGDDQFSCFSWIISHESNWNVRATNRSSGAYGLPQSLPGSKMASEGSDWRTNPATQIIWGVKYMKNRYGSPCGTKSHWERAGNY